VRAVANLLKEIIDTIIIIIAIVRNHGAMPYHGTVKVLHE